MTKHGRQHLNKKRFEHLKKLTDLGLKGKTISEISGYCQSTISVVKRCPTWKYYQEFKKRIVEKTRTKPEIEGSGIEYTIEGANGCLKSIDATLKKLLLLEERKEVSRNEYLKKKSEYQEKKRNFWDSTFGR